jgi:dipeptidyl aminopeptidase/acylaminoacyl peptidase
MRLASLLILLATPVLAQLTPEEALKTRRISDLTFSPDGSRLACVVSEFPKGPAQESHIWMLDVATGEFRQFTFSPKSESSPRWSPDGKTLAFLSAREERMQIYLIRIQGGEAVALTSGKSAAGAFRWSPDGKQIAYMAAEPKSEADEKKEKDKDDVKVFDRETDLSRLWLIDLATKKPRQITHAVYRVNDFEFIGQDKVLAIATKQHRAETWTNALFTISLADGAFTPFSEPKQPFGAITVSPNLATISFTGTRTGGPSPHDLFFQSVKGSPARNVTAAIDRPVHTVKWQSDTTAVAAVTDGFRSRLYRIPVDGPPTPIDLPLSASAFDITTNGTLAYVGADFDHVGELYLRPDGGSTKQISHLHSSGNLATAEIFRVKSFDGQQIEAALMKPQHPRGGKAPLILYVHGGPAGSFAAAYSTWPQLLAAHGYQVLMVNPRGSNGYGEAFLKANREDWGGGDFKDLIAVLDSVIARGEADPNRVGIGGWSYGGYMAEWAITQTNRFKAAVSGAGLFDLAAEFGTENGPAYDEWYFSTPWEHPEKFAHSSPATYIRNAKTPTLILQGENDTTDPMGQSTALYRALKRYGVETELALYPREPHGPREEKHQLDILTRMLGWFDRYLNPSVNPAM